MTHEEKRCFWDEYIAGAVRDIERDVGIRDFSGWAVVCNSYSDLNKFDYILKFPIMEGSCNYSQWDFHFCFPIGKYDDRKKYQIKKAFEEYMNFNDLGYEDGGE